ncbi:uncharacterized protein LOC129947874 isoform X2 [Eupeodes corollae]|uniref:uncharacterized protein LOC129947874 isoform X2 n=1 Tax=Eupeodes corollae TaxID=290404 RepID=UPI00248FDD6C|nr:uncharacterized protein LOC129947874 isoform X2 [Eupeodes corollae]
MSTEINTSEGPSTSDVSAEPNKKPETHSEKIFASNKYVILSECRFHISTKENHLKRLQNLRKELNYLKETEWMYDPLEKRAGQQ